MRPIVLYARAWCHVYISGTHVQIHNVLVYVNCLDSAQLHEDYVVLIYLIRCLSHDGFVIEMLVVDF